RTVTKPVEKQGEATSQPPQPPQPDAVLVRMAFANAKVGWACGEAGTIQSTVDGGATWRMQFAMTKKLLFGIAAIDEKKAVIVGAGEIFWGTMMGGLIGHNRFWGLRQTWTRGIFMICAAAGPFGREGL